MRATTVPELRALPGSFFLVQCRVPKSGALAGGRAEWFHSSDLRWYLLELGLSYFLDEHTNYKKIEKKKKSTAGNKEVYL